MQQHPVPQNISSYEFRLVGDMTLKQFFQLAGGFLVAFILYKTPLVGILKWPLMFISGLTGVLMAFVPVNGRPFSQWILAFIHAIYSPTRFVWNPAKTQFSIPNAQDSKPLSTENFSLSTTDQAPLDKFESQLFSRFSDLFAGKNPFANAQPSTLNTQDQVVKSQDSMINTQNDKIVETVIIDKPILPPQSTPTPPPPPPPPIVTPPMVPTNYEPTNQPASQPTPLTPIFSHSPISAQYSKRSTQKPVTSNTLMQIPETPNIISGVVINAQNASVESAIIEITDMATGIPVRALRTNKLGQFKIATPVGNGKYQITTEKDGLSFETLTFEASGKVINPIQIIASGQSSQLVSS